MVYVVCFFFFKQKAAYEMRISDWSSEVCSSDLTRAGQAAAVAALGDEQFVAHSREHNATWRAWLAGELESLGNHGVRVVPSACNFLLVLFEGDASAETVYNRLMDAGYIVRWLTGQGLPNALRMTIGTEDETRGLAAAIRAALNG